MKMRLKVASGENTSLLDRVALGREVICCGV